MAYPKMLESEETSVQLLGLEMDLPFEEDPTLQFAAPIMEDIHRPPGIKTLDQWGRLTLPDGKWQGKMFLEVPILDPGYCKYMKNHKCTSAWALSFQNYLRAMEMTKSNAKNQTVVMPKASSKSSKASPSMPSGTPSGTKRSACKEDQGFVVMDQDDSGTTDKVQTLMAQIAILQRELASIQKTDT